MKVYGVSAVCRILGLARSSYYHQPHARADASTFERDVLRAAGQHPTEGSRRLTARLRRRARWAHISRERVRRGMRRLGILRKSAVNGAAPPIRSMASGAIPIGSKTW